MVLCWQWSEEEQSVSNSGFEQYRATCVVLVRGMWEANANLLNRQVRRCGDEEEVVTGPSLPDSGQAV